MSIASKEVMLILDGSELLDALIWLLKLLKATTFVLQVSGFNACKEGANIWLLSWIEV